MSKHKKNQHVYDRHSYFPSMNILPNFGYRKSFCFINYQYKPKYNLDRWLFNSYLSNKIKD